MSSNDRKPAPRNEEASPTLKKPPPGSVKGNAKTVVVRKTPARPNDGEQRVSPEVRQSILLENIQLHEDYQRMNKEFADLRSTYAKFVAESTSHNGALSSQITTLEAGNARLAALLSKGKKSGKNGPPKVADIKASKTYKDLKADLTAKIREAGALAHDTTKEKADKQYSRLSDQLKDAKQSLRDCQREASARKKEIAAMEKAARMAEQTSRKIRDQLTTTRVDLMGCMRSRKAVEDSLKAANKTLASTEKKRAELKKELDKALECKAVRAKEAADLALKREQILLERDKVKSEAVLHNKMVFMELDTKKKEHLLLAKANIKKDMIETEENRQKGKRDNRKRDTEDRIYSSLRAVGRVNRFQNDGEFPLLNSPEATFMYQRSLRGGLPPVYQDGVSDANNVANIVSNVMNVMASRGSEYLNDPLQNGISIAKNAGTGEVLYGMRNRDGSAPRRYFTNRDDLFRKPSVEERRDEGNDRRNVRQHIEVADPDPPISNRGMIQDAAGAPSDVAMLEVPTGPLDI